LDIIKIHKPPILTYPAVIVVVKEVVLHALWLTVVRSTFAEPAQVVANDGAHFIVTASVFEVEVSALGEGVPGHF
jgi:hypothetical protein